MVLLTYINTDKLNVRKVSCHVQHPVDDQSGPSACVINGKEKMPIGGLFNRLRLLTIFQFPYKDLELVSDVQLSAPERQGLVQHTVRQSADAEVRV